MSCAQHLTQQQQQQDSNNNNNKNVFDVTVFDTGRLRPGGRCSSRMPGDPPKEEEDDNTNINRNKKMEHQPPPVRQYPLLSHFLYDHAAQILTVPSSINNDDDSSSSSSSSSTNNNNISFEAFQNQVHEWESKGVIQRFAPDSVYSIDASNGSIRPIAPLLANDGTTTAAAAAAADAQQQFYYYFGTNGMGSIPQYMANNNNNNGSCFELKQNVWVSPSNGAKWMSKTKQWKLQAKGQVLGYYDRLVIAHNGKCADRLLSKTPAKAVHSLLRVNFADRVPAAGGGGGGKRMTLNSIYSLTIVCRKNLNDDDNDKKNNHKNANILSRALPDSFVCGFVQNHPNLTFLSCPTRKYKHHLVLQQQQQQYKEEKKNNDIIMKEEDDYEVWTILSSARFAKQHKAPQEFLSDETIDTVSSLLLQSVEEALGSSIIQQSSSSSSSSSNDATRLEDTVLERRLQLWGAALPLNVWRSNNNNNNNNEKPESSSRKNGFIYDGNYGVGVCGDWLVDPSLAGAWTSGKLLADYMMKAATKKNSSQTTDEPTNPPLLIGLVGSFRRSESAHQAGIGAIAIADVAKTKQVVGPG